MIIVIITLLTYNNQKEKKIVSVVTSDGSVNFLCDGYLFISKNIQIKCQMQCQTIIVGKKKLSSSCKPLN